MEDAPAVVGLSHDGWAGALDRSGFWALLGKAWPKPPRVLILVDLGGARRDDPAIVAPGAVEALIDLIHSKGAAEIDLAASADESQLWAGNRDIYALAELLGYRFVTDGGHDYDIVDLGANLTEGLFPPGSVLRDSGLCSDWLEADVRLNLARLRAEPGESFAGGLLNLLGCLPLADKALHYRHRRSLGEVISALIAACPPHHTLIEAARAGVDDHTAERSPLAIASGSPLLADYAAALKAGLDPFASELLETVAAGHPLPQGFRVEGSLEAIELLQPPAPLVRKSVRARQRHEAGDRLLSSWLRGLSPELFPAARPLDARGSELAAELVGPGTSRTGNALLTAANLALGAGARGLEVWRTLFDKDAFFRRIVPIGIDPAAIPVASFTATVEELASLLPLAATAPRRGDGLRWRTIEKAVVFEYSRSVAIPFELFVARVDVARTISFMNDYLGGVVVVLERDDCGRSVRQAERNLYLPQPNYLALYGGKPIDVTKIEVVRYEADAHRLYWKTILSSNGSATADDGVAFFEREGEGTRITFAGKQRFTLPPLFEILDLSLLPELETALTTQAYQQFFDRTCANLEALVEGREIMLGRAPEEETPHPSLSLEEGARALAERAAPLLASFKPAPAPPRPRPDARGFVHVVPQR